MEGTEPCALAAIVGARLRGASTELTTRWLERVVQRVSVEPNHVFPSDELLDHMPRLIEGIADYVECPERALGSHTLVLDRAMELGDLRHEQGFAEHELQKEYEILGGVLFAFVAQVAEELGPVARPADLLTCSHRIFQAISRIQQVTVMRYLQHATAELAEREGRLRTFQRALAHEMRNRVGATLGAGQLLELPGLSEERRRELVGVVVRNAKGMQLVLENLLELARERVLRRHQRHVRLPAVVREAARQLRESAERAGVAIRISPDLPDVEVNAAALELSLVNYLSNAIKYADPRKPTRWVEVRGRTCADATGAPCEVVVEVADNGLGVPEAARSRLFERFFRAHERTHTEIEGTGLGLSIIRETVEALGGRAWAEFPEDGAVFALAVPCRRTTDARPAESRDGDG